VANLPVRLHPLAADELEAARRWYHERNPEAAAAFLADFDSAILAVAEAPQRWPRIHVKYRRYIMQNFHSTLSTSFFRHRLRSSLWRTTDVARVTCSPDDTFAL
jgi:plasmid stabilization system protein ParE